MGGWLEWHIKWETFLPFQRDMKQSAMHRLEKWQTDHVALFLMKGGTRAVKTLNSELHCHGWSGEQDFANFSKYYHSFNFRLAIEGTFQKHSPVFQLMASNQISCRHKVLRKFILHLYLVQKICPSSNPVLKVSQLSPLPGRWKSRVEELSARRVWGHATVAQPWH